MDTRNSEIIVIKILVIIIGVVYLSYLYIDINNIDMYALSDKLKFISIILIFTISILEKKNPLNHKDIHLLQIGLFITIFADLFLLVLNSHYVFGMILFSIVQILYSFRYEFRNVKLGIRNFIIMFLGLSILYIILNKFNNIDFIWMVALFYAICLLASVRNAIKAYKYKIYPKPNRQMILIGMILFLLCDINVALYNIMEFINLTGKFVNISFVSMWLFYLPSQVLLALSGYSY